MSTYDGSERPVPVLDAIGPYAGPCAFCGFGDRRHRLADAVIGGVKAGDPVSFTAESYGVTPEAIDLLLAYSEESRRRRRHRWEVRDDA